MGELRQGIERIQRRAAKKAAELNSWLHTTLEAYEERILPIDRSVAEEWGRMNVPDPLPAIERFTRCDSQNLRGGSDFQDHIDHCLLTDHEIDAASHLLLEARQVVEIS